MLYCIVKSFIFLENDNKRADVPKISENFCKIREQTITREREDIPKKGPVKLIKRVKIAHSFLQSVSDQFQLSC